MGSVNNIIGEWVGGNKENDSFYLSNRSLLLRWLNEGQLRFADKSEVLRGVWSPTISSSGSIALPTDFLREILNRVQRENNGHIYLQKLSYPDALLSLFTGVCAYSIWGDTFYVWAKGAASPIIPYIKKPTVITEDNISSADLEIPTEYHHLLYEDRKSTRLNSSHVSESRMPSSA